MKIVIGCDHIAYNYKCEVIKYLKGRNIEVIDVGTYDKVRTHYPIYGREIGVCVAENKADLGIAICGTGVGVSNSVNKVKGANCMLVNNSYLAKIAKENYDCNVIAFGSHVVGLNSALDIVEAFLNAKYLGKNKDLVGEIHSRLNHFNGDKNIFSNIIDKWEKGDYTENVKQEKVSIPKY